MNAVTIIKYILGVIDIIIMLALIIVVLVQYKDENGASGTIVGASSGMSKKPSLRPNDFLFVFFLFIALNSFL